MKQARSRGDGKQQPTQQNRPSCRHPAELHKPLSLSAVVSKHFVGALHCVVTFFVCAYLFGSYLVCTAATAQGAGAAQLLTVSKPPASLLPTDPPQGQLYTSPTSLGGATVAFDSAGGPVSLEYVVFDRAGTGYLTFDDGPEPAASGGVMIVPDLTQRSARTFDRGRDQLISGSAAGLAEPKDLYLIESLELIVVADFAGGNLKVFDTLRPGDTAPVFTTSDLGRTAAGEPRLPWGVTYHEAADRLFVSCTDGTLLVYDAFIAHQGESGPDRTITLTHDGRQISDNLHELIYLPQRDSVVVTDVGAATTADQPGFAEDGAILMLEAASRAAGPTQVALQLSGPDSLLGNPVALVQDGDNLFVAENAADLVLRFDGLLGQRGNLTHAPNAAVSVVKPESVVLPPSQQ